MTFEEIQKTIEGMLAVQKELQDSQLKFAESLADQREETAELRESIRLLRDTSQSHERRIERLIGYSITGESDRLDTIEQLQNLERRIARLERSQQEGK